MTHARDPSDGGLGGPGIWDQMPLVPPTRTPKEVDDSKLIWSKPKLPNEREATGPSRTKTKSRKKTKRKSVKKPAKGRVAKKKRAKLTKTAGRRKKRR